MNNQGGFSLVEVLVAMVILAIGLFGVMGMQLTAMTGNRFSYDGSAGIQAAEYMIDLVRLNGGNNNIRYDGMDTSVIATCEADADCGPWRNVLLNSSLINPIGMIAVSANSPTARTDTVTVQVEWGELGARRNITLRTVIETWRG